MSIFCQVPPDLEDYLRLDKILIPPTGANLGVVWEFDVYE